MDPRLRGDDNMNLRHRPHRIILPLTLLLFLSGGSLYYWRANSVRLTSDGQTRRIFTQAHDVNSFLEEQNLALGPHDQVTPASDTPLGPKTAVKITRVTIQTAVEISTGTPVVTWQTRTRQNLRRALAQKGYSMVHQKHVRITRHDGAVVKRHVLRHKKTRRPFFTLTLFDARGHPAKTYNLLKAKKLSMRATGYYVGEKTVPSDTTYLGYKLRRGVAAVDPKVIPLRTRLYVEGYGYAYAADTGSAIKGLRIDLAVSGKKEEARFNRQNVQVYILEKAKTW